MPSKPIELPPKVAKAFLADLNAYHEERNGIGTRSPHVRPGSSTSISGRPSHTNDVKDMFERMKDLL
jgi:hypothetical protein